MKDISKQNVHDGFEIFFKPVCINITSKAQAMSADKERAAPWLPDMGQGDSCLKEDAEFFYESASRELSDEIIENS